MGEGGGGECWTASASGGGPPSVGGAAPAAAAALVPCHPSLLSRPRRGIKLVTLYAGEVGPGEGGRGRGGGLDGQRGWRWAAVGLRRRAGGGRRAGHAPPLAFDTRAPGHQARHPLRGLSGPGGEGGREWGGSLTASAGGVVAAAVVVASV